MAKTYFFTINAKPVPNNVDGEYLAGAIAHVFSIVADEEKAKLNAIEHLANYGWGAINFEHEFEMQHEQLAQLETIEAQAY